MSGRRFELKDAVVAITGGARGIGLATAGAFAAAGGRVATGDLDGELRLDVTDRESVDAFHAEVERRLGPVDVWINNAGIMPVGPFLEEPAAVAARQVDVNLHGVLNGMKAALPGMVERRRGHVVNVASGAGKTGFAGGATYCATKHAVVGLTEAARREYRAAGVRFSLVMPAVVNTELTSGITNSRLMPDIQPDDVAAAIVHAVRTRRFDVYVPRRLGVLPRLGALLPRRGYDALVRLGGGERALLDVDAGRRAAYEERIAAP